MPGQAQLGSLPPADPFYVNPMQTAIASGVGNFLGSLGGAGATGVAQGILAKINADREKANFQRLHDTGQVSDVPTANMLEAEKQNATGMHNADTEAQNANTQAVNAGTNQALLPDSSAKRYLQNKLFPGTGAPTEGATQGTSVGMGDEMNPQPAGIVLQQPGSNSAGASAAGVPQGGMLQSMFGPVNNAVSDAGTAASAVGDILGGNEDQGFSKLEAGGKSAPPTWDSLVPGLHTAMSAWKGLTDVGRRAMLHKLMSGLHGSPAPQVTPPPSP